MRLYCGHGLPVRVRRRGGCHTDGGGSRETKKGARELEILTVKAIKPGYVRTAYMKNERGYAIVLCKSKNYATPGTTVDERKEDITPIIALEMTDAEQAHNLGTSILIAAERMRADEERGKN